MILYKRSNIVIFFEGKGIRMKEILKREELLKKADGDYISGCVLMKAYSKQPTKNGGFYLTGNVEAVGTMAFKVWGNAECFSSMDNYDFTNHVVIISGKVNVYNGVVGLVIDTCNDAVDVPYSASDFYQSKYNAEAYWNKMLQSISKRVSPEAMQVLGLLFTDDVKNKFMVEFAAVSHHDNCRSGLLAHTAKVVQLCQTVSFYDEISNRVSKDELFIGAAIHDIGKILEYDNGVVSGTGKVLSHNTIGILMLEEKKDQIIALKGEDFYLKMLSVIAQHHGEYGERPRTVLAYVINQLDCLDSVLTSMNQQLEGSEDQIVFDGMKLL